MEIVEYLMKVGFTRHESILYVTLCKEGELTGYEAAKISGIPRSNAYLALAGLVEKGGAWRIESDAVKYVAVPTQELTENIRRQFNDILEYIQHNAPSKEISQDPYITITGKTHIFNKTKNIISHAVSHIYLSLSPQELKYFKDDIESAIVRGLKVVIITSPTVHIDGATMYHNDKKAGQIRLIADTTYVLTGEVADEGNSTCLYSKNKHLVQLIKDSLTNEIELIKIQEKETRR